MTNFVDIFILLLDNQHKLIVHFILLSPELNHERHWLRIPKVHQVKASLGTRNIMPSI